LGITDFTLAEARHKVFEEAGINGPAQLKAVLDYAKAMEE